MMKKSDQKHCRKIKRRRTKSNERKDSCQAKQNGTDAEGVTNGAKSKQQTESQLFEDHNNMIKGKLNYQNNTVSEASTSSLSTEENLKQKIEQLKKNKLLERKYIEIQDKSEQTFLQSESKIIAKQYLFQKVKFVLSRDDLNVYGKKSIGSYFIKCFNRASVGNVGNLDGKRLWDEVKEVVYKGLLERRNAVVYSIRSKWEGRLVLTNSICNI